MFYKNRMVLSAVVGMLLLVLMACGDQSTPEAVPTATQVEEVTTEEAAPEATEEMAEETPEATEEMAEETPEATEEMAEETPEATEEMTEETPEAAEEEAAAEGYPCAASFATDQGNFLRVVHQRPDPESPMIRAARAGFEITVVGSQDVDGTTWYETFNGNTQYGWVQAQYLVLGENCPASS